MKKSFYLQKHTPKQSHDDFISLSNTYTRTYINPKNQSGDRAITQSFAVHQPHTGSDCKQNQYALLNLSIFYTQNDVDILNTKNNEENTCSPTLTCRFMIHICAHIYIYSTYILTKYRARNSFMLLLFYLPPACAV